MTELQAFLDKVKEPDQRARMEEVFDWVMTTYPQLEVAIKWNQPMFTDHGTFIIAFSHAKAHMSFAPEEVVIARFSQDIKAAGYDHTKGLAKIKWQDPVNYDLLKKIIDNNIMEKADCTSFWRS